MKNAKCDKYDGSQDFMEWSTDYGMQPGTFSIAVLCGYMAGAAKTKLNLYLAQRSNWTHDELILQLGHDYHDYSKAAKAREQLAGLRQGKMTISAYNQKWQQLATLYRAIRDEDAKMQYLAGARDEVYRIAVRNNLMARPLNEVIAAVTEEVHKQEGFEARHHTLQAAAAGLANTGEADPSGPMPMELGYMAGYPRQQQDSFPQQQFPYRPQPRAGRCNACGQPGHWARNVAVCLAAQQQQAPPSRDRQQPQQHTNRYEHLQNYRPHLGGQGRGRGRAADRGRGRGRARNQQINA
jgi:hypothetical protein